MTDARRSQMIGSLRASGVSVPGPSNTCTAALVPTVRVTILSLRGISVSLPPTTAAEPTRRKRKVPRLTASVTFSGSCPPESMQIPSSTLCGRSGRLKIVSGPTWPNVTCDDTTTEECTTQSSLSVQWDTLPEGEGQGPSSTSSQQGNYHQHPHLTVALPVRSTESERQTVMDETIMAPEGVAPSTGEPTGTSSGTPDENMPAQSAHSLKTVLSLEDDLDEPGVRFQMMQERATAAPTQMAHSPTAGEVLPEIIEMNLTVLLDTVFEQRRVDHSNNDDMNPQDDKEDDIADYDDEDGEAEDMGEHSLLEAAPLEDGIAHLVLFGGHARIEELDLPVRKRHMTSNGRESVATIPSLSDTLTLLDSSSSTTISMSVALEDNAALRVRVEVLPPGVLPPALIPQPCPSMDESSISVQSFFSMHKERVSPQRRLMAKTTPDYHTGYDDGSGGSMVKIPDRSLGHDSQKEKKMAAAGTGTSLIGGAGKVNVGKEAVKILQQKQKEETANALAAARQQRQTSDIVTNVRNRGCFAFEGIGDILMSLAGHCNEGRCNDDNLYVYAADSMASTIDTFESL
eukprot:CAMPEP_0198306536 /NCGR_PEP_ID=MMETSP1449-20131203/58464_1 /TAXON_ID=420275 /ORGANISM="Attheya septentrionalis, Strain CCMP2084" /LENGTH=571 /DNA_ID=CAMNT_0044009091 /DNA_START=251 /DNA_END=1966 /DNA_ORIENTATION=+